MMIHPEEQGLAVDAQLAYLYTATAAHLGGHAVLHGAQLLGDVTPDGLRISGGVPEYRCYISSSEVRSIDEQAADTLQAVGGIAVSHMPPGYAVVLNTEMGDVHEESAEIVAFTVYRDPASGIEAVRYEIDASPFNTTPDEPYAAIKTRIEAIPDAPTLLPAGGSILYENSIDVLLNGAMDDAGIDEGFRRLVESNEVRPTLPVNAFTDSEADALVTIVTGLCRMRQLTDF